MAGQARQAYHQLVLGDYAGISWDPTNLLFAGDANARERRLKRLFDITASATAFLILLPSINIILALYLL